MTQCLAATVGHGQQLFAENHRFGAADYGSAQFVDTYTHRVTMCEQLGQVYCLTQRGYRVVERGSARMQSWGLGIDQSL